MLYGRTPVLPSPEQALAGPPGADLVVPRHQLPAGVWTPLGGYQGGYTENPTYEEVCSGLTGHTEAVRVVFDPSVVSHECLLKTFWASTGRRAFTRMEQRRPRYAADSCRRRASTLLGSGRLAG